MWGRKAARIAELEARNALLVHQITEAREDADAWKWAAHRSDDTVNLQDQHWREFRANVQRALTTQRGRTARHRTAWLSARCRASAYRAELVGQQRVVDRLTRQLFDAMGYEPADRAALETPRTKHAA